MKKKHKIIVSITGIILVALILGFFTYGYYLANIKGNTNDKSISQSTDYLELTFADDSAEIVANGISPGTYLGEKEFTVTNTGDGSVDSYAIVVDILTNANVDAAYKSFEFGSGLVFKLSCTITNGGSGSCGNAVYKADFPSQNAVLITNTMKYNSSKQVTHKYTLDVYYEETGYDQSDYMGVSFRAKIDIKDAKDLGDYDNIQNNTLASTILNNAIQGKSGIKFTAPSSDNTVSANMGNRTSGASDKLMFTMLDNIGTSYIFRGNVDSNYVDFAGMCWRIVRINGDGSIKLILEDKDQTCYSSDGNWNITASTTDSSVLLGNWGKISVNGKYVSNYLHPNTANGWDKNSMANAFKLFQTSNLNGYLSYLNAGNWCINDTVAYETADDTGDYLFTLPMSSDALNAKYVANTTFNYSTLQRITNSSSRSVRMPSIACNDGSILNNFDDDSTNPTPMYVGTITVDEAVVAGGSVSYENQNYYLLNDFVKDSYTNGTSLNFYTLSKSHYSGSSDWIFAVSYNGLIARYDDRSKTNSFRPAINLKANTAYVSGDGTKTNPYKVS